MRFLIVIILILIIFPDVIVANEEDLFQEEIEFINESFDKIIETRDANIKKHYNSLIENKLQEILEYDESFDYDFSKFKYIVVLDSDDEKLRIYNWNLAFYDGSYKYFGFLQYRESRKEISIFKLNDFSQFRHEEDRTFSSNQEWYGALYYEIITTKWNRNTYYTLLGWDGADFLINRKVIENLHFTRKGLPKFGENIFIFNNKRFSRMVYEYADRATMLLRYNAKQDIIVLDHLSPPEIKFTGLYQYYGPDLSYDAFRFLGGKWVHESDIDPDKAINFKRDPKINAIKKQRK